MFTNKLICQCANIREEDVRRFLDVYEDIPINVLKSSLNVGFGCGSCQRETCEVTEIKLEKVYEEIIKSKKS